jgi:peptidyl-dipeptidase Dcp
LLRRRTDGRRANEKPDLLVFAQRRRMSDAQNPLHAANPLLADWTGPFGLPPFGEIAAAHYRPAFEAGIAAHLAEINAIAENPAAPDFDNTIGALERAGKALDKVGGVFWNLCGTDGSPEMEAIERDMSGALARHMSEIKLNPALFARIEALYAQRGALALSSEQLRVLELTRKDFLRAGATLQGDDRARMTQIVSRLAELGARFSQNVLADEAGFLLLLDEGDLDGLSENFRAGAAALAAERGAPGKYGVSLSRSSVEPFLQASARRDLREAAFAAWTMRGEKGGETDNRALIAEILKLREEQAQLLGFASYADYKLDDTMARAPKAVRALLDEVWDAASQAAARERVALQQEIEREGANFQLAAADWRYYAERARKERFNVDQAEIAPYFQLDNIIAAAFHVAERLFGLRFSERRDLTLYHEDVRAFDVTDASGAHVALFLGDYFARPTKRGGAWMSEFRGQQKLAGDIRPIVVNVLNFAKPAPGAPVLLSLDDARTLFHEFGHALHGMLSNVTFPRVAGTNVARDFVELPSQLYEHWLLEPVVLRQFARHADTDEPMPEALLERILAARYFNQGFATVEFLGSAFVDLDLHEQSAQGDLDIGALEQASLARIGMPQEIVMRHRTPHFSHVFSGDGYSAGYYSYMWAEVLDADAFEAFKETGDPFAPELAAKLRDHIYAAGGSVDPGDAYVAFRGRMPTPQPLLRQRGFA